MALNGITHPTMKAGMLDMLSGTRVIDGIGAGRATVRWPWPLPMDSVLACFDDAAALPEALVSLHAAGVAADDIWTVSGQTGAGTLRAAFSQHGTFGRLRSLLGDEGEIAGHVIERCERGGSAVLVRQSNHQPRDIIEIAAVHGARLVRRTGRWISEWMVPRA
jgi:hypothetical protein